MARTTDEELPLPMPTMVDDKVYVPDRNQLRDSIFNSPKMQLRTATINFNGVNLEFRQPTVLQMGEVQSSDDSKNFMVKALIAWTFIPGTDQRIFDDADYDLLANSPMNDQFQKVISIITETLNLNVDDKEKN